MTEEKKVYAFILEGEGQELDLFKNRLRYKVDTYCEAIDGEGNEYNLPVLEYGYFLKSHIVGYFIRNVEDKGFSIRIQAVSNAVEIGPMKEAQAGKLLKEIDKWVNT